MTEKQLGTAASRVVAVLQAQTDDGWIDRDSLIEAAGIQLHYDSADVRTGAVEELIGQLHDAGYTIELRQEESGDFYRLARQSEQL